MPAPAAGMRQGERALLEIKPAYAFMHKDWKADVPPGLRREDTVKADVEVRVPACWALGRPPLRRAAWCPARAGPRQCPTGRQRARASRS